MKELVGMSNLTISLRKIVFIVLTSLMVLAGCSNQFAASMRKVTYAPDFKYTEQAVLRSDMGKLGQQMSLLEQALIEPYGETPAEMELQREQVLTTLRNMAAIASRLKTGSEGANHPFMEAHMQDLTSKIDKASVAASLAQPRYYFAGKVSGGYTSCHQVNR
ncbi:MAG: hypothetical protein ACI9IT_002193 [Glaciecola sp.]|jgi:hypothetical protein